MSSPIIELPKVSLHDHLDGGVRAATVIELADSLGVKPFLAGVVGANAENAGSFSGWVERKANSGSLEHYLETFDATLAVMQTEASLSRIAKEFVQDLVADGVILGEIRWAPEQHLSGGLSLDAAVEAVQSGINEALSEARVAGTTVFIGQLLTAMRHRNRSIEIARLALRHRDKGVVGFDIAGPEAGFSPGRFREAFDLLQREFFPVTVHAGEADGVESIKSALVDGHALRLGHGVRVAQDIGDLAAGDCTTANMGVLARWVLERQIPLEMCPSSNVQTGAIDEWGEGIKNHPFGDLYRFGYTVTVNTDNRLMSKTNLTKELSLLVDAFGYGMEDLLTFQLNAAEAAFLPREDKLKVVDKLRCEYI